MSRGDLTVMHALLGALVAVGLIPATLFEIRLSDLAAAVADHELPLQHLEANG
jgi:hypothetical protein